EDVPLADQAEADEADAHPVVGAEDTAVGRGRQCGGRPADEGPAIQGWLGGGRHGSGPPGGGWGAADKPHQAPPPPPPPPGRRRREGAGDNFGQADGPSYRSPATVSAGFSSFISSRTATSSWRSRPARLSSGLFSTKTSGLTPVFSMLVRPSSARKTPTPGVR